ncbi:YafY family protein [Emticicia sp. 21SJ11W-3]|uniref:helix-turn-helix transcriptional regulator n=1 Tax=Emticicia sp. 21SJ11W-3 TaxID=2916755 RepID=UPI0020A02587|nr:YafY family protein [Emticicia sp. 21SJ11W-3]UTA67821.1 YafY family transcriptional regulator [Emticicia sp. 21SJ11W-3]
MNRIDRLMAIVTTLQSKKFVSAESIAEKYEISVRTVYRDIKALGELGIPVGFENQKGYFVVPGYFLPPVAFSIEEANALLLMESVTIGFADKSIRKHYSSALSKVKAVLRTSQKEKMDMLTDNIRLQIPQRLNNDFEYLSSIQNAIIARNILEITYVNNKEESSKRQVEAIGLVFYAFSWHMIAWCHLREEYRDFKVSRICSIQDTGILYRKKNHITLNDYQLPVEF